MDNNTNLWVMDAVKDITVAKMTSSSMGVSEDGGKKVAAFMEEVYNKLVDLVHKDSNSNQ